jgi:circadian clock protein KaiB
MKAASPYRFRLYVAGNAENSLAAVANLRAICARFLSGVHQVEVIDVLVEPMRALADGVLLTPMLLKVAPLPMRKIVGSLSERDAILRALDLQALSE